MEQVALADILTRFSAMSEKDMAELGRFLVKQEPNMYFIPNPGPQTEAYYSEADELFYGGSAGCGKSALLCGIAVNEHEKSKIFRREYTQIRGLEDEVARILGGREGYNSQSKVWRIPNTSRLIEFGAVQYEDSKDKHQGVARDLLCVGIDTPVRMANGEYKPIQDIIVGDFVDTLAGPKIVTMLHKKYKPAIRVNAFIGGVKVASQVQGRTHELLTSEGWVSPYKPNEGHCNHAVSLPTSHYSFCKFYEWLLHTYGLPSLNLKRKHQDLSPRLKPFLYHEDCQFLSGLFSSLVLLNREIYFSKCYDLPIKIWQHFLLTYQQGHFLPFPYLSEPLFVAPINNRDDSCVPFESLFANLTDRYSSYIRQYDEQPHLFAGDALLYPQPQDDVEQHSPINSVNDDVGKAPKYNYCKRQYVHPYTKEICQSDRDGKIASLTYSPVESQFLYDLTVDKANHYITGYGFVNKNCFDEICHFTPSMYRFLIGWNRTTTPGQRSRVICAGNPPLTSTGLWVINYWGAWLDPKHNNPAKPGELRWYTTIKGEDIEVDGPGPHHIDGREVHAKSRTFIPGKLEDNPDLFATGYASILEAMPEPYRTMLREGRFDLALQDNVKQCIPTSWVQAAMKRWTANPPANVPMCALAADVARGGEDDTVIASRYDFWFSPLITRPGKETPLGSDVAGLIVTNRRDNAAMIIDMGGGYGGAVYEHLLGNIEDKGIGINKKLYQYKGAEGTTERSKCRQYAFRNVRSAAIWRMREALDPDQPGGSPVALPYDNDLLADLTTPTFEIDHNGLKVETKESVCKRLGRSPDKGDAVMMCNYYGIKGFTPETARNYAQQTRFGGSKNFPKMNTGHDAQRRNWG